MTDVPTSAGYEALRIPLWAGWISVWCYDKCHSICRFAASKNDGQTSCKCRCHDA